MPLLDLLLHILNTINDFAVPILGIAGSIFIFIGRHREATYNSVPSIIHQSSITTLNDWEEISKRREAMITDLTRDYDKKIKDLTEENLILKVRIDELERSNERKDRLIYKIDKDEPDAQRS